MSWKVKVLGLTLLMAAKAAQAQFTSEMTVSFNGPANRTDYGTAVTVDAAGNIYMIANSTDASSSNVDCVTLKYNSAGALLWADAFTTPDNHDDRGNNIQLDNFGNVIVGGVAAQNGQDFVIIKYSSSGVRLWVSYFNGTLNAQDYINDIDLDAQGNTYAVGASKFISGNSPNGTLIKVDPSGNVLWSKNVCDEPLQSVDVDEQGIVRVAGSNLGRTIAASYLTDGTQQWFSYGLPSGSKGQSIVNGNNACAYLVSTGGSVMGQAISLTKFNSTGAILWIQQYPSFGLHEGKRVSVDEFGNAIVVGTLPGDFTLTAKYASDGAMLWSTQFQSANQSGNQGLSIGPGSQIYATSNRSCILDSNGSIIGAVGFNWKFRTATTVYGNCIDKAKNLYTVGSFRPGTSDDALIVKYVPAAVPNAVVCTSGRMLSGQVDLLRHPDDERLGIQASGAPGRTSGPVVEFTSTAALPLVTEMKLNVESSTLAAGATYKVEMFDYVLNSFVQVGSGKSIDFDTVNRIVVSDPERYVQPGTRTMRARCSWSNWQGPGATVNIDQVAWILR